MTAQATAQKTATTAPVQAAAKEPRTVRAHLRYLRMSPRKARYVANAVQRMPAADAVDYLKLLPRAAAHPIAKLIRSALANASHNFQIAKEDLVIHRLVVDQGPTLKRHRPRAFGRAGMIRKRSCHITVVLAERAGATRTPAVVAAQKPAPEVKTVSLDELRRGVGLGDGKSEKGAAGEAKGVAVKGFRRKLFQRKAG